MNCFTKAIISLSVLLNLLLAGVIIGHVSHRAMGQGKHITLQDVVAGLPADQREHFKEVVLHADQDINSLRQQLDNARKKAVDILKTDPFDKEAYIAQVQIIQQLKGQITQRMTVAVIELAGQSGQQDRASMASVLFP